MFHLIDKYNQIKDVNNREKLEKKKVLLLF